MSKQYTRSEVASSNNKEKTLIILHDKVYDVASFLNEHPGGEEILLDHGGKDGSEDFDDVGHSVDALELMKNYLVGELVEAEKTYKKPKHWNAKYNTENKQDQGTSPLMLAGVAVVLLAVLYFVYL
ncbi:cytochrome b5-like [Ceratina calcarata]|uniref:Cytochrome b5-like n=1 Tax=Ceratina calcarata TaxID=156304 RepID=A0AAJ7N3T2_9HYME|nr:cytochrome b5-like [Ceratina calcarata]